MDMLDVLMVGREVVGRGVRLRGGPHGFDWASLRPAGVSGFSTDGRMVLPTPQQSPHTLLTQLNQHHHAQPVDDPVLPLLYGNGLTAEEGLWARIGWTGRST